MASIDFRPGINEENTFSFAADDEIDFRPGIELPAVVDTAVPPPTPPLVGAVPPVDPLPTPQRPQMGMPDESVVDTLVEPAQMQLGQDGINPVSVFNPAPLTNDQIIANEQQRVTDVMGQLGPTTEKANLNLNPTVSGVSGTPDNYTMDIMGSPIPIDNETAAAQIARGNTYQLPNNALSLIHI